MTRTLIALLIASSAWPGAAAEIIVRDGVAALRSGALERVVRVGDGNVSTTSLSVAGREVLAEPAREFSMVLSREKSNRAPRGLTAAEAGEKNYFGGGASARWRSEGFDPSRYDDPRPDAPKWIEPRAIEGKSWRLSGAAPLTEVTRPAPGVTRLAVRMAAGKDPALAGVHIELYYELYDGHAAVRKWIVIRNRTNLWLKLERLVVDDLHLAPLTGKPLAAAMHGVQPSVVAFEAPGARYGVIAASEIPSALRSIAEHGAMGYTQSLFEWVLGPGEEFSSEPVFYYAFHGPVRETVSAVSTPLDRTVEGPYMEFVKRHIGVAAETAPLHGPQWMTWAYFYDRIDDQLVRQLADIAARAGFTEMLFDDGWQKGRLGTEVDTRKFPDFAATSGYIRSRGMALGLWVSCFRDLDSRDLAEMPEARVLPVLLRSSSLPGLAMSFASRWREYYVKDLVALARRYHITYFKQDFTNVMYGDLAAGHESRTRKESLLRGLRGLLDAQAMLRRAAPEVVNEITHEIYWGTPGVPADLAALKHTARFHIPPNESIGSNIAWEFKGRSISAQEHGAALRRGCWLARQRFYSHRALPLYALEFYAATSASHLGSLTSEIQDRQVASWLMGMPVCFSGDARTMTDANIAQYRKRFDAVKRLQSAYGIYRNFQFSGVPEPTDVDWHWWGKLNAKGHGAVVVVRGSGGAARRMVNIPWVAREASYRVAGLFSGKAYGVFRGQVLQDAGVAMELPVYGQELLDMAPVSAKMTSTPQGLRTNANLAR
jgi:hypothetical protein